ncbi:MAG TPA: hypothetical protein VK543_10890 [Puia sp.]|nr:hypothetical protein [Puia sp.]
MSSDNQYYINRLVLLYKGDPFELDPLKVLRKHFEPVDRAVIQQHFRKICEAALSKEYREISKRPANTVFFIERIEILLEIGLLLKLAKKQQKRTKNDSKRRKNLEKWLEYPLTLSLDEMLNPSRILEECFHYKEIAEWKNALHDWMEASLSNHSIIEVIEPSESLTFVHHGSRMIDAMFVLIDS